MSIKIMSWVWDNSPYRGKALLLHLALADFANDDGICWPSQATLAHKARCSVEYVRQLTRRMEAEKFVTIISESTREGRAHQYRLSHGSPTDLGRVPNWASGGPQLGGPTSPNPSPSNRQEPPKNPRSNWRTCADCGEVFWAGNDGKQPHRGCVSR